jgi:hypothetical protein
MKWNTDLGNIILLYQAIWEALSASLGYLSKSEPQLVANLVVNLPNELNGIKGFKNGFSVKAGSVFVHGQPFVKCDNFPDKTPASVEIGDLLLLRTGISNGRVIDRRALLLQAKKYTKLPAEPDNKNQYHLYAQWPAFEYVRSTADLNNKKRQLQGFDLYDAAKYLLIPKNPSYSPPDFCVHDVFTAKPLQPALNHYYCFLGEMIEFLLGNAGKEYSIDLPEDDIGWSRVIEDLTTVTAERSSKFMGRAVTGKNKAPRGQGQLLHLAGEFTTNGTLFKGFSESDISEINNISRGANEGGKNEPPKVSENWSEGGGEGGISIIELVVSEEERRR